MSQKEIGRCVHKLSRQLKREMDEEVSKYGITGVQCGMIRYIAEKSKKKKVFARDIEKEFDIRRASATDMLQNMEKNGLIKREKIALDGRLKTIVLTPKALELVKKLEIQTKKVERKARRGISEKEVEELMKIIEKISNNLEEREMIEEW